MSKYFVPFAEREDGWYLYFPVATVYHNRRKIDFTEDDAKEMVANFGVIPDYELPINILHRDEFGQYGHVAALRFKDDEVQWQPAFRDDKMDDIKDKGYKYMSPEVAFKNYQSVDGAVCDNVALGAALTPRPRLGKGTAIFSDEDGQWELAEAEPEPIPTEYSTWRMRGITEALDMLKSLEQYDGIQTDAREAIEALKKVAHKVVDQFDEDQEENKMSDEINKEELAQTVVDRVKAFFEDKGKKDEQDPPSQAPTVDAEALKAQVDAKFAEFQADFDAKIAEKEQELADAQTAQVEAEAKVKEFSDKLANEERERQLVQFSETAKELEVPVEPEVFAEDLMLLHDADKSEGKESYNRVISVIEAMRNADKYAELFSEKGTNGNEGAPEERRDALIQAHMSENKCDVATATAAVIKAHPEFYE